MSGSGFAILVMAICLASLSIHTRAAELSVNGFANFGLTYADSERYGFRTSLLNKGRDGLSIQPDTQIGFQLNAQITDAFDAVGQIILQDRHDDHPTNYVELAFLRMQIDRNWSVRAGRFSTNSYLFTDYRYVGYAHNWLRPPLELYSPVGSLGNMDGISVNRTSSVDFGVVKMGASFGQGQLHNDRPAGDFRIKYNELAALNVELQATQWRVQAAFLTAKLSGTRFRSSDIIRNLSQTTPAFFRPFAAQATDSLIGDGKRLRYFTIGGAYYFDNLEVVSEIADYESQWDFSISSTTGYISLAYAMNDITPYVILSTTRRGREPDVIDYAAAQEALPAPLFAQLVELVGPLDVSISGAAIDQDSVSFGVRWDVRHNWAVKLQVDHFTPKDKGSGLFTLQSGQPVPTTSTTYNVLAISATTTF
jgi:hypothetical protein